MSTQVQPEEAQAIRDAVQPQGASAEREVSPRDFGEPLRLSLDARALAERDVRAVLGECEKILERELRRRYELELVELAEMNAEGLFANQEQPVCIVRFEVEGQPGWVRWDQQGALGAVETALGAQELSDEERELTLVERNLIERMLGKVVAQLGLALGVTPTAFAATSKPQEVGTWHDGGKSSDSQRLRLHLQFDGPGGPSGLDVYMPGLLPESERSANPTLESCPDHLSQVSIRVSAHLGQQDIAFGDLLELEEGDIVPLSTPVGSELRVLAEDVEFARAIVGQVDGRVAIQITSVGNPDDNEEPQS